MLFRSVSQSRYSVRDGDQLHLQLNIPMTCAALGSKQNVETLDGEMTVEIKPGTQSGDVIPIKGKGMTRLRGGGRGELFVHINVEIPAKLSKPEEELLRSFAKLRGEATQANQVRKGSEGGLFTKFRDALRGQ